MAFNLNLSLSGVAALCLAILSLARPDAVDGFVLAVWPTLRLADWGLAALLGAFLAIVAVLVALAYRLAPTPIVGVFDTSYLAFAAVWGAVFFAEVPDGKQAIGIAIIACGAVLMNRRSPLSAGLERSNAV